MKDNVRVILFAAILGLVCSVLLVGATLFTAPYRLANEKAEEIRRLKIEGMKRKDIALLFGITVSHMDEVCSYKYWA